MPLKYYPLTRIIQNKYTRGNEFSTLDGKAYTGRYYITYDNKTYTGINPVLGTNEELIPIQSQNSNPEANVLNVNSTLTPAAARAYTSAKSQTNQSFVDTKLTELAPYYPLPLDNDYTRGYFTRYFAKTVTGPQFVFEISPLDWTKIQNGNIDNSILGYETMDMLWQLTGPLNDKRISQYQIQGGVYDTNKRVTEAKAKGFAGIIEFIGGDYTKFAKITP